MEEIENALHTIRRARRKHRASLKGLELEKYDISSKLRSWIIAEDWERPVNVPEVVEKVSELASYDLMKSQADLIEVVENIWSYTNSESIKNDEYHREELENTMLDLFGYYNG